MKHGGGENDFLGCALLSFFRDDFGEYSTGAERGRIWRLDKARHCGDFGVQIIAPSSIIAWFQSPGAFGVEQRVARLLAALANVSLSQISVNRIEPRKYARDVAVEHRVFRTERDA